MHVVGGHTGGSFCYILVSGQACVLEQYVTAIPDITPWEKRNFAWNGFILSQIYIPQYTQT